MSKQIIIVKPGTLSSKDKEKLTKVGNIVIVHEKSHEINYHIVQDDSPIDMTYTCCYTCGDRIYVTKERMTALKTAKKTFYCPQGHSQVYK